MRVLRDGPAQLSLLAGAAAKRPPRRATQVDRVASMLREARSRGCWVPLPEIMRAGIAQHGARLHALRQRGFRIENRMTRSGGIVQSCYRLVFDPEREGAQ